jgi:hypothetical protein
MSKTPIIISVILSIIILLLVAVVTMFSQIVVLNGVMNEGQATTALVVTLGCQAVTLLLGAILAGWATRFLIERFTWNPAAAVFVAVLGATALGVGSVFISVITGVVVAGVH